MVDFKKLREAKAKPKPINPRDIFNALPKPPGINDLYASQAEVLDAWFARRTEKDTVIKLHTGGGKTLVALLMAQSVMNETGEPVLYLAPTNQLVEQVLAKSKEYGIPTVPYQKGKPLSADFYDGTSVLVGSYETLFNGRSKFGVRGTGNEVVKVGAIVLDDAHVALSSVRDAFTLTISSKDHQDVYTELADRFRPAFKEVSRSGQFADIVNGKEFGVIEVPSWAWQTKVDEIQQYLSGKVGDINAYVWPFLRDNLSVCHCLFSKSGVSITPLFPPLDMLPTFEDAPRRIYMSATIADDSEIIRSFGTLRDAVARPITSTSLAGVGERMILVPGLMRLGGTAIISMVKEIASWLASHKIGVAILTPSGTYAKQWTDIADYPNTSEAVSDTIAAMQSGVVTKPVVLANRYDGIDLAGNACRFLVMDNLPQGTSNYDVFRMNVVADAAVNSLLAQRIEQGLGRGTRGGGDYCVIMMIGNQLEGWIGKKKNVDFLTASTRVQLKMGQEVSEAVTTTKEVGETILKCLNRDADWVAYHASELAEAAHAVAVDELALSIAAVERKVFKYQRLGQYAKALSSLEELINGESLKSDPQRKAWLAASAARISFQMDDDVKAQKLQTMAFSINNNHCPPRVRPSYVARPSPGRQAIAIVERLLEYGRRAAILADFDAAMGDLVPEASATRYEEALARLGSYLGFEAERPEKIYGVGPDVLWRTDATFDFVIEAKSEKNEDNPLYKKDHAQLLEAEHWFKQTYPGREAVRVSALPEAISDERATPAGSYAFRLDEVTKMVTVLRGVFRELIDADGEKQTLLDQCEAALTRASLKPIMIKTTFMKPFGKAVTPVR
ncbi:DEAD/DEAH box helicase [Chromobacterium amazonense]|uniref:DEAD/DEAH box helicase n=1 Tax=Chromobacterium amazonense TaxID=1382803 RepID=UPI00237E9B6B|nr:DEAD/DEAH box helicase [Chromobacterium amazonense]MDE1716200.1 DEAD/DEAH box helicase [Chromobacterium amazonense]